MCQLTSAGGGGGAGATASTMRRFCDVRSISLTGQVLVSGAAGGGWWAHPPWLALGLCGFYGFSVGLVWVSCVWSGFVWVLVGFRVRRGQVCVGFVWSACGFWKGFVGVGRALWGFVCGCWLSVVCGFRAGCVCGFSLRIGWALGLPTPHPTPHTPHSTLTHTQTQTRSTIHTPHTTHTTHHTHHTTHSTLPPIHSPLPTPTPSSKG